MSNMETESLQAKADRLQLAYTTVKATSTEFNKNRDIQDKNDERLSKELIRRKEERMLFATTTSSDLDKTRSELEEVRAAIAKQDAKIKSFSEIHDELIRHDAKRNALVSKSDIAEYDAKRKLIIAKSINGCSNKRKLDAMNILNSVVTEKKFKSNLDNKSSYLVILRKRNGDGFQSRTQYRLCEDRECPGGHCSNYHTHKFHGWSDKYRRFNIGCPNTEHMISALVNPYENNITPKLSHNDQRTSPYYSQNKDMAIDDAKVFVELVNKNLTEVIKQIENW
jgi:hypothetical protein